jgi:hypothetical protein
LPCKVTNLARSWFEEGFHRLAISMDHGLRAGLLPRYHGDPFRSHVGCASPELPDYQRLSHSDSHGVRRIW